MKAVPCVLLLGIVLVGCAGDSLPMLSHEEATVEQSQPEPIFPGIKPVYRTFNLEVIEKYCQRRDIRLLGTGRVRLFVQPVGVVAEAVEIDLTNRQLTAYPGTHSTKEIVRTKLSEEETAQIRALVTSEEFKRIPAENNTIGRDGVAYLVETSIDNVYSWKLHWAPEDRELMKVVGRIQALSRKNGIEQCVPADAEQPRR